ncbi:ribulose bisphosphate carboxylase small subunit [Thiocystis violacea]|uniref:ribulose bisphosphate carboxylase small subunit n=1 Tax=Thiocystis violacea TaxID=13725 RepID=UPI00190460C3|nr:ribulose bisphosphate carboxylase small subunit [Thiocystis violacea]MBK1723053.1 ribulose 1,5-bisphosphate carboxylase small subunit [Thiocystis violacea]
MYDKTRATEGTETTHPFPGEAAILDRLSHCIQKGCFICIEHASAVQPRLTFWERWGKASCFDGDLGGLYASIEGCKQVHADHHIRLNVENIAWRSRLSLVVHRPH